MRAMRSACWASSAVGAASANIAGRDSLRSTRRQAVERLKYATPFGGGEASTRERKTVHGRGRAADPKNHEYADQSGIEARGLDERPRLAAPWERPLGIEAKIGFSAKPG